MIKEGDAYNIEEFGYKELEFKILSCLATKRKVQLQLKRLLNLNYREKK